MKYSTASHKKIEQIFDNLGYAIRYEKGNFQSGYCLVEQKKMVVINKFFDNEGKMNCLLEILSRIEIDYKILEEDNKIFLKKIFPDTPEK